MLTFELEQLEHKIKDTKIEEDKLHLIDFLNLPSKRLRPKLIFLILKMLNLEIKKEHINLAYAVEILHSATLIHDDIIDDASLRRGKITTVKEFGAKSAVLGGDYLLSVALFELSKLNNQKIIEIFSKNTQKMIESEITQLFERGKIPTLDEYLEKNINKTALLFLSGVQSALLISNYEEHKKEIEDFTLSFGLAFQILNDLKSNEDKENGIYTLKDILCKTNNISDCDIIVKDFVDELIKKTNKNLDFTDNVYKKELCEILYKL